MQLARTSAMTAMAKIPAIRHFMMREGVAPTSGLFGLPKILKQGIRDNIA